MGSMEKVEKLTWTIENFSEWDRSEEMRSETFFLSGLPWQIRISEKEEGYLSIFLFAGDLANLPEGWSRVTNFKLSLINQANDELTIVKETEDEFHARKTGRGFNDFIEWRELCYSNKGFIVNDTCIIEAEIIFVRKSKHESQVVEATSKNLVEFRGLGKIENVFVPLLEEVCSWHPSLVDCHRKRKSTRAFTKWAFTALGRVLYFLNTRKLKDMDEDACDHLKILWGELETCGFDLTWLKPHFESVMGMKGYLKRHALVKKLKRNVEALEMDLKTATRSYIKGC